MEEEIHSLPAAKSQTTENVGTTEEMATTVVVMLEITAMETAVMEIMVMEITVAATAEEMAITVAATETIVVASGYWSVLRKPRMDLMESSRSRKILANAIIREMIKQNRAATARVAKRK